MIKKKKKKIIKTGDSSSGIPVVNRLGFSYCEETPVWKETAEKDALAGEKCSPGGKVRVPVAGVLRRVA